MIITCPECLTKFQLDETRVPEGGGKVRCSRCKHIFQVPKSEPAAEPPPPAEAPPEEPAGKPPEKIPRKIEPWTPRKKPPRNRFPLFPLAIAILILAGGGYGAWMLWGKSSEGEKSGGRFSTVKQFLGLRDETKGSIALERVRGYFLEHATFSRIFIIEGRAVNQWKEPRSFIKVKGTLQNAKGTIVEQRTVYCGNLLEEKDLKELPKEAIEKSLSSQFGISFSNVNVPPQKSVPFMIVFMDFAQKGTEGQPASAPSGKAGDASSAPSDFAVEVVSSQKGSK